MEYKHIPVMLDEVIKYLDPKQGENFIDCTLGGGGYTLEIAKRVGENGKVLAIDLDENAVENVKSQIKNHKLKNIILANGNFKDLQNIIKGLTPSPSPSQEKGSREEIKWDGIIFDLGLSSAQLADKSRGFSFQLDAPLNMEFGIGNLEFGSNSTKDIVNKWKQDKLEKIIREYGEERYAGRIARGIVEQRKIKPIITTGQLVEIIESVVPASYKYNHRKSGARKIHFATRTFQALRIATNQELENLEIALPQAIDLLKTGGRIAVVSFHSLEDRIVKNFFKKESKDCLCPTEFPTCQCGHKARLKILTKKPLLPSNVEIENNPRARSAKMRAAIKI
jgi:16S rRNA (cytosine1402-N4)-methyltransferase